MASVKSPRGLYDMVLANEVYFTDRPDYINYPWGSCGEDADKTDEQKYTHTHKKKAYRPIAWSFLPQSTISTNTTHSHTRDIQTIDLQTPACL